MSDHWDFVRESNERITQLNNELLALERDPDDEEAMRNVFRIAHTLKGNCGAAGFDAASDVAHAIEDLLDAARAGRIDVTPELMDVVFDAVDELEAMVREIEAAGELTADPESTIRSIREYLERESQTGATTVEPPSGPEIDAVVSSLDPPTAADHDAYLVRFAVQETADGDLSNGTLVVEALIDAFDVLGTDPSRDAIDAGRYGGQLDVVFTGAVGDSSIAAALEPIDEIADFEIVDVSDRFDAAAEGGDVGPIDDRDGAAISTEEARDLEVDELLDEFDEFDDLDEKVKEVEGDDDLEVFDEMGDAGSFDDLFDDADVEPEVDPGEPEPSADETRAGGEREPEDDAAAEADDVDDAEAVFAELKEEVDPVGFDELQDELAELEFDEFGEEEIGMDELLGDDLEESLERDASEGDASLESGPDETDGSSEGDGATGDGVDDETAGDDPMDDESVDVATDDGGSVEAPGDVAGVDAPAEPVSADLEDPADATAETPGVDVSPTDGLEADLGEGVPTDGATWDEGSAERPSWCEPVAADSASTVESETDDQSTGTSGPDETAVVDEAFTFDDIAIDDADPDEDTAADSSTDDLTDERADEPSDEWVDSDDVDPGLEAAKSLPHSSDDLADETERTPTDEAVEDLSSEEHDDDGPGDDPVEPDERELDVSNDEPADAPAGGPTLEDEFATPADEALDASTSLSADSVDSEPLDADETEFEASASDDTASTDAWSAPESDVETSFDDASDFDDSSDFDGVSDFDDTSDFEGTTDFDDASEFEATSDFDDTSEFEDTSDFDDTSEFEDTSDFHDSSDLDDASGFDDTSDFDDASDFDDSFDPTPETAVSFDSSDEPVEAWNADGESDVDARASPEDDDALETAHPDPLETGESDDDGDRESRTLESPTETPSADDEFGDVPTEVFELDDDSSDSFEETFGADALSAVDSTGEWDAAGDSASTSPEDAVESAAADEATPRVIEEPTLEIPDITVPESVDRTDDEPTAGEIQSVRMDVEQIDDLLNLVEGLVTTRVRLRHAVETELDREVLESEIDGLEKLVTDLQGTVMDVRLVPLETIANRLPRVVRDVARDQEKAVDFEMDGTEVELDRGILDRLRDPLIHLIRNAVDHGIEPPADREAAGKPREGSIEVSASRERDQVTITVSDDGRGLDPDDLRSEAVEAGVLNADEAAALTDDEAYDLAFHPGLSTAEEVTDVSGRGVGMDVVERTIDSLDGTISIDSELGEGTTVTMTLPVSIAIDDVLFVESGGETFGIPTTAVQDVESVAEIELVDGDPVLPVEDDDYPVIELEAALEMPTDGSDGGMLIRVREDVRAVALQCDMVGDQQEVVVKPFEGFMADVPGLSGATVRGRGAVVPILDVTTL